MAEATDRWRCVEHICQQALDRPAAERDACLRELCGGDDALRGEVQALLQHEHAGSTFLEAFLEAPAGAIAAAVFGPALEPLNGRRIGHFEIGPLLGAGGMGEVYRAHDTKLDRDVALKMLPQDVAMNPERLRRLKREAQALAALNHPNIAAIYGFEEEPVRTLVLELVEGPTLEERIAEGPLPLPEALAVARQMAEAIETAHEAGIVHRDLKPANIKLRPDGVVKVLDFGIAKALHDPTVPPASGHGITQLGAMLGTSSYMSPEQVKGLPADRRSDIWAFGAVLYEMLTSRTPFRGETPADILAAVMNADPVWTDLPADTPHLLRRLLHRCLQKDPKYRLQHIGDARLDLVESAQLATEKLSTGASSRGIWPLFVAAGIGALAVGVVAWILVSRQSPDPVTRFIVPVPPPASLLLRGTIAVSPDGGALVYVVGGARPQLMQRRLDDVSSVALRGGEGGTSPFFSPDGAWIGFFADGKLKKIPADGGLAATICDVPPNARGAWGEDGTIVVARTHLYKVPSGGGTLEAVVEVVADEQFSGPEFLPGSAVVLVRVRVPPDAGHIEAIELETGTRHALLEGSTPRLAATGDLLFSREGRIWATAFDAKRLAVIGTAVPLVESVSRSADGEALFAVSQDGSLAYVPMAAQATSSLVWLDRTGAPTAALTDQRQLVYPRVSPDGTLVAASVVEESMNDVWVFDLARGSRTRLTTSGSNRRAVWSPDGHHVAFFSLPLAPKPGVTQDLYVVPSTGGTPTQLLRRPGPQWPDAWSPDGRFLVFEDGPSGVSRDLWLLPFGEPPRPLVVTRFNEHGARFSPDGHWLAFVSDESGRAEVYVQPFPGPGQKVPMSTDGGIQPVWSRGGEELFYRERDSLMTVPIRFDPFRAATPRKLFDMPGEVYGFDMFVADYDLGADGRLLAVRRQNQQHEIHVALNWTQELGRALGR